VEPAPPLPTREPAPGRVERARPPAAPGRVVVGTFRGIEPFKTEDGTSRPAVVAADQRYGGLVSMYPLAAGAYVHREQPGSPRLNWSDLVAGQTVHLYLAAEPASNPPVVRVGVPDAAADPLPPPTIPPIGPKAVSGFFQGFEPYPVTSDYPFPIRIERKGIVISDRKDGGTHQRFLLSETATAFHEPTREKVELQDLARGQSVHLFRSAEPSENPPVVRVGVGEKPKAAAKPPYVIEPPDILLIEAFIRGQAPAEGGPPGGVPAVRPLPLQDAGQFVVRPDGTVGLGVNGSVSVTGLTIDQAAAAVREYLVARPEFKELGVKPESLYVVVDVKAFNSKRYYVIAGGPDGEAVHPFPITGSETVLDALGNVPGLAGLDASAVWVRRKGKAGQPDQTLPVDWKAITQDGATQTNYQLQPGDRVYVKRKK
jgi:protein involved in polysaccharide export with SLBB domain